jgi:predicted nucleic acid-binding protein
LKIFVDTNVLLDVLGKRVTFYGAAAAIWTLAEQRKIEAIISAVSFTNIFYIVRKLESRATAMKAIRQLRKVFVLAACDEEVISKALDLDFKDFEDGVQLASAVRAKAFCLVTRNPSHFARDLLPILTPREFLIQEEIVHLLSQKK